MIDRIIHHILQLRSNWIKRARADLLLPPGLGLVNSNTSGHTDRQWRKPLQLQPLKETQWKEDQDYRNSMSTSRFLLSQSSRAQQWNPKGTHGKYICFRIHYKLSNSTVLGENYNSILKLHTWGWWCFHALCSSFSLSTGSTWTALSVAILNLSAIECKLRPQHKWSDDKQWQRDSRLCGVWQHVMCHRFAQFQSVLHLLGSF